ncbi:hypothetical protein [Nannocystis sp. SCPEA4]|uniref:hypothetical protein n=1 Tax=Nannocystis sp. SCPEA4 TaxID=2996787 RepID=UPI0022701CDF|nr:hypothetical protein [Nannocystis sp. SCPEA4]MCY1055142.1 hypothetical protein [Nannocystis sp. SCPEA4]
MAEKTGPAAAEHAGQPVELSEEVAGPSAEAPEQSQAPETAAAAAPETAVAAETEPRKAVPAQVLGRTRGEIEKQFGALRFAKTGWATTPADDGMHLQFHDGRCVGIRGHVPEDMDCLEVAAWLGYQNAYPLRRKDYCDWPGLSMKHRLAEGVSGHYVLATGEYQISLQR